MSDTHMIVNGMHMSDHPDIRFIIINLTSTLKSKIDY